MMGSRMTRPAGLSAAVGVVALVAGCATGSVAPDVYTGSYIVELTAEPLVSYAGGIQGLAPTSPKASGTSNVDPAAPASQAYLVYLKKQQVELIAAMTKAFGRPVVPVYSYYYALDGFAVRLTAAEAARAAHLPGVSSVRPDKAYPTLRPDGPLPPTPPSR